MKRGLTLIELLVVVAIILLLAGLTFSLARSSIGRSKLSACASNLGQIGKAVNLYAAENEDRIPPIQTFSNRVELTKGEPFVRVDGSPERWVEALQPFVGNRDVLFCPADDAARTATRKLTANGERSNEFTSYETTNLPVRFRDAQGRPNVTLSAVDIDLPYAADVTLHLRGPEEKHVTVHGDWANVLYLDGRVQSTRLTNEPKVR
jgi:prepilin-type N-terminal cleavage/methylation domain-containing protein/prepilin-type processing-associated H-X9-DG protein